MPDNKQDQFSRIYDQYIEKIYRFVYLKVDSKETAEDITSRTFTKGWEAYQSGQDIKNPGAFLYQIARNSVIDHYREKGRNKAVSVDSVAEIIDQTANIHEKAVQNAQIEDIKSAILHLKQDYQDVLIMHYLEDMSAEQIAQFLDKPTGTVRVTIHRGLKALKNQLNQEA